MGARHEGATNGASTLRSATDRSSAQGAGSVGNSCNPQKVAGHRRSAIACIFQRVSAIISFPTDPYERLLANMAHAHDTYRLAYQRFGQLSGVLPRLGIIDCGAPRRGGVGVVPVLNQKLDFSAELEQYVAVAGGLTDIIGYFDESRTVAAEFDAGKLKGMMEAPHDPLFEHLSEEVDDLSADNLKVFTVDQLARVEWVLQLAFREVYHAPFHAKPHPSRAEGHVATDVYMATETCGNSAHAFVEVFWVLEIFPVPV
ncbi:hypothetical protein B0H10DRAFT_2023247 [Mycena sp. CBHHK59/15]|nr:hypothetical protein B0H10DRAFT_2023247 [Mycena sp. CBHHK59/15]